jgi:hypothetical protein
MNYAMPGNYEIAFYDRHISQKVPENGEVARKYRGFHVRATVAPVPNGQTLLEKYNQSLLRVSETHTPE